MKIAYILGSFPSTTETFVMNEIIQLIRQGLEIEVYSIYPPGGAVVHPEVIENNLLEKTFYFRYRNILKLKSKLGFLFKLLKLSGFDLRGRCTIAYFAQLAEERGINHLHSHFIHRYGEAISRLAKIPYSFTAHCYEEQAMSAQVKARLKKLIEYAKFVVTATDFAKRGLASMVAPEHRAKIHTVRCGINVAKFTTAKKGGAVFTIVSVAGLYPRKGTKYLIEALAYLQDQGRTKVFIVGDGPLRHELEELARQLKVDGMIEFTGKSSSDEVEQYLNVSDCFILPCIISEDGSMDGLPVALMEAMAMGLPAISTPVAGIPELVINGETGFLVPQRDSRALAEAIMKLSNDPQLREAVGKRARQKVVHEFNLEKTGKQLAEIFKYK